MREGRFLRLGGYVSGGVLTVLGIVRPSHSGTPDPIARS